MSLGHVSDADAIRAAAKECDELGQEAFLEKYGFAATRYVVEISGKQYPGKAVVAVAHGIQFPDEGPLQASQFAGGQQTTNRILGRLGFMVVDSRSGAATEPVNVWLEITHTNRPDRIDGPYRLGSALWSPKTNAGGGDLYRELRRAKPGDWVLHLTNAKAIVGRSRIESSVEDFPDVPQGTQWSDRECQLVRLRDFEPLDPALSRTDFFSSDFGSRLKLLKQAGLRNAFFTKDLELAQGRYFSELTEPLLHVLRDSYYAIAGEELIPGYVYSEEGDAVQRVDVDSDVPAELVAWTHLREDDLAEMLELLDEKKQLILFGPPGSGKTYVADAIARHLTDNAIDPKARAINERYELVQFHQSYGYEDFIQGIRPKTEGSNLTYAVEDGILKLLRDRAAEDPDHLYVILVDEINRGNLSRIFGELLLLLEYRGESKQVRLPYEDPKKPRFTLPENLYFVGTMNTADRSLAQIDYALRRRFFFYRLTPVLGGKAPVLEAWLRAQTPQIPEPTIGEILRLFVALNEAVTRELGEDFQIGHSYFMTEKVRTPAGRDRIWRTAIEPLLDEYFQNRRNRRQLIEDLRPEILLAPLPAAVPEGTEPAGAGEE